MKIVELLNWGEKTLRESGRESWKLDAELLLAFIMNVDKTRLFMKHNDEAPELLIQKYEKVIKERATGVPVQRLTGMTDFMGLPFKMSPEVLIPRHETEILVEEALKLIKPGAKVLELCTGSGCIAISLFKLHEYVTITATDISEKAVYLAKENARDLGIPLGKDPGKIQFVLGDLFGPVKGKFDLIVVNPPYVKSGDLSDLMPEVKDHDPRLALDGGPDGLLFYRRLLAEAKNYMLDEGLMIMEIGEDQAKDISEIAGDDYEVVEVKQDYNHKDRIMILKKA